MTTRLWGQWGAFFFDWVQTLPVSEWNYETNWKLPPQENVGYATSYQWLGRASERVRIRGKLAPASNVGKPSSIASLLSQADQGIQFPLILIGPPENKLLGNFFLENYRDSRRDLLGYVSYVTTFDLSFVRQPE